ncbi:hypothetical protein DH2020_037799 [Rehmannia glutinosa]|uniref:Pentatricopeptide repeat-containing protein n=1 Tax=Rehmannia glutinosa TaxID=99300 RepID=A0ABR0V2X2_REHGL
MHPFLALRHTRRLSTAGAGAAADATSSTKPVTITTIKNKLKRTRDPDEILKVYSSFSAANLPSASRIASRYALESTVRLLVQHQRFSGIETLLESQKSHPHINQEPFLSSLIRSYGMAGMFENALKTYQQMPQFGTPRSTLSFNALLHACVNSKLFDRVPVYFGEFPSQLGFSPDKFSYGILIKSYCEMDMLDSAMEQMNVMEENGIEISATIFTTILNALYRKGKNDEADKFWDEMVTNKRCSLDVASYNVRFMHNQKPEGLIEEITNAGLKPNTVTYNLLITFYGENKMMDEVKKVYDEMLKAKDCNPDGSTFRSLVFYLCKHGWVMTGYKVFKQSVKVNKSPSFGTLQILAEGLVEKGHMNEAKDLIWVMNKKFPSNLTRKLAEDLGLAPVSTKEVDSGEKERAGK